MNSPGWKTGVGSFSLLCGIVPRPGTEPSLLALQADSLPAESVQQIIQARMPEWVAISYSRGSSQPRDPTHVGRWILHHCATWEAPRKYISAEICLNKLGQPRIL